jgi:hypothetical protein
LTGLDPDKAVDIALDNCDTDNSDVEGEISSPLTTQSPLQESSRSAGVVLPQVAHALSSSTSINDEKKKSAMKPNHAGMATASALSSAATAVVGKSSLLKPGGESGDGYDVGIDDGDGDVDVDAEEAEIEAEGADEFDPPRRNSSGGGKSSTAVGNGHGISAVGSLSDDESDNISDEDDGDGANPTSTKKRSILKVVTAFPFSNYEASDT